jgi:DNA-binding transcriptional regulator YdaS (Cro superfamily)
VLELQPTLLNRAAQIAGGTAAVCEYLGVSEARFQLWLTGRVRLPDLIFLRAVDLILRDDIARAANDRRRNLREDRAVRNPVPLITGTSLASAGATPLPEMP